MGGPAFVVRISLCVNVALVQIIEESVKIVVSQLNIAVDLWSVYAALVGTARIRSADL